MRRPYEQLGPDTTSGQITGDDTPSANRMEGGRSGSAFLTLPPALSLPKGGGAIRGIGEKFTANPVTGTGTVSVPIAVSPGRNGFGPQLSLTYDSGAGNGPFGLGWNLNLPSITRKTDKGLPRYLDHEESDVFILAGAEDLVPVLGSTGQREADPPVTVYGSLYHVRRYRPRIEGLFALIERWTADKDPGNTFWRTISRDNVTTWFGRTANSRIYNPDYASRVFQWLICESYDDKGNVAVYHYVSEDANGVDRSALAEANRLDSHRGVNRYLKHIRYGNIAPFLPTLGQADTEWHEPSSDPDNWMFEVVFDYGDHAGSTLRRAPSAPWRARKDAFSTHRAGFEMRTYCLCRRVLMFHHFPEREEVGRDCLVRSTDFEYAEPANLADATRAGYTILQSVSHRSYQRQRNTDTTYEQRQLPPVSFAYSQPVVDQTVRSVDPGQLANLPVGTQGSGYQWIDLDGEGLSGVLTEQAGAWYYKPNLGDGQFGPIRQVAPLPAMAVASGSRHQFMDLAGDGEIDVVDFSGPTPGFHERDRDEGWKRHVPFASLPNIDWNDPNLRFVDLTGDGHADALLTEQDVFTWYPSLAERGFAASERSRFPHDEDAGPRLVFADGTQTVFLADMCGDGLTDLVRIRNGQVCYWPNLGYGHFGRKVTLGNSPRFDHSDLFDPRRIRLADIDGSGPIDIIYLGRQGARLYFNRSGNSLSDALHVALPLATENLAAVQVADLLGNGTACLVWNSHLPTDARNPVRYIDLMGGIKPHLLIESRNNLGGSTEIEYTPSTRFYLQDQQAGTPWITRLPFPVHCVSKVTVRDKWRGTAFTSTYSYHHGYFDGIEREFRGFGRVEQVDVEHYGLFAQGNVASPWITNDRTLYQPPVKTITWYHTGAAIDRRRILSHFEQEYFPQRYADRLKANAAFEEKPLPEPELPTGLDADEWLEALRACKGMVLRQELFEVDIDDLTAKPAKHTPVRLFSAATHNCNIQRIQPRGDNRYAVFLVTESEALTYHHELDLRGTSDLTPDPRIAHTLNLRHDEYGNPQQSVAVGYGRVGSQPPQGLPADASRDRLISQVQRERYIVYTETRYTTNCILPDRATNPTRPVKHHRLRLPCEVRTYELTGITTLGTPPSFYFDIVHLRRHALCEDNTYPPVVPPGNSLMRLGKLDYHEQPQNTAPHRRIVEHARTLYFDDAGGIPQPKDPLPFGQHGPRGLKYEDYKIALTSDLLTAVFGNKMNAPTTGNLTARQRLDNANISGYLSGATLAGRFQDLDTSGQYWMRSGVAGFSTDAAAHFYLPEEFTDPFNNKTTLAYDGKHDLFIQSSSDARGNTTSIERFDYRVLAPREMVDINGNHTETYFDILGMVVASAVKGKRVNGAWEGDNLDAYIDALANPPLSTVLGFCTANTQNNTLAKQLLGDASARFIYHFGERIDTNGTTVWNDRMAGACGIVRERHASQVALDPAHKNPLQVSLECSDGSGNVLMKKVQAEPDPVTGQARWIVNGLKVLNNKGKPVKQYEPAFSDRFGCELPGPNGVTPIMYYDAPGRLIRTELPDGTFSRVEFSPWHVKSFDQNDTVTESRWYRQRLTATERGVDPLKGDSDEERLAGNASPEDKRAARLAAVHSDTPALTILDSLGRDVIAIAHNHVKDPNGPLTFGGEKYRDEKYLTFTKMDAEGKPLWIRDARGNLVMQYIAPPKANNDPSDAMPSGCVPCYDIAGNLLFQHSMDAGDRWMLMDAAGKPMLAWDLNDQGAGSSQQKRIYRTDYDALHRPTAQWLKIDAADPALVEAFEYCDTSQPNGATNLADAQKRNLIGQAVKHWDPSGLAAVERVDLSGQPAHITRTLVKVVPNPALEPQILDWNIAVRNDLLETETFIQITEYDALGRMTTLYNWHRDITFQTDGTQQATQGQTNRVAVYVPSYNARGALQSEWLYVRASKSTNANGRVSYTAAGARSQQAIKGITYNAKGQKLSLELGNGTTTRYTYDPNTFRLIHLYTRRNGAAFSNDCTSNTADNPRLQRPCGVQNLHYTYDPVGNITRIQDDAQQTIYFANSAIEPSNDYTYDALYRLIEATGRENAAAVAPPRHREDPWPTDGFPSADALRNYAQRYSYDAVGNFVEMAHQPGSGSGRTRHYTAQADSNRLHQTWYGSSRTDEVTYRHDAHGNMLNLNRVESPRDPNEEWGLDIRWDWRDMISGLDLGGGGVSRYHYGIDKQRTRKHITRIGGVEDRIYLGGYELYRRRNAQGVVVEEIESLHLLEGEQRVLLVDDVLKTDRTHAGSAAYQTKPIFRYQYSNHLGSACMELDERAEIISYEEYHPYGTSAYRLMKSGIEAPPKRYRYTGMERDEESGLAYHTARYYLPWLGRWASADPIGIRGGTNVFLYVLANPISNTDENGKQPASSNSFLDTNKFSLLDKEQTNEGLKIDESRFTLYGSGADSLDMVNNPAFVLLTMGQMRQSIQKMPLILPPTEAEKYERMLRDGPQLRAGPSASDAVMGSSIFPAYQMKLMNEAIRMPLLGAALPTVAAGLGTFVVGSGYHAMANGDYELAKQRFFLGIELLSSSQVGFEMSAMRKATASANNLQLTLESQIFGSRGGGGMFSPALRSESVIATGVMRNQSGRLLTTVTVNNGFRSKIASELSLLAEEHGAVFVSGASHAERNLIAFAREMNISLSGMPIVASSPVCEVCALAGHSEGVVFQNNPRGLRYMTKGWKAMRDSGYVAPAGASISPHAANWIDKYTLFPGVF